LLLRLDDKVGAMGSRCRMRHAQILLPRPDVPTQAGVRTPN
jgi:hypothetical protein